MLTRGQQRAFNTLQKRQASGNIRAGGLARLDALRAVQASDKPAVKGGILGVAKQQGINVTPSVPGVPGTPPPAPNSENTTTTPKQLPGVASDFAGDVLNQGEKLLDSTVDAAFKPIDFAALPAAPGTQDLGAERQRIEKGLYDKYTRNFEQDKSREDEALQQYLAERGIGIGSGTAYSNARKDFTDSWNQRYDDASARAIQEGGTEWERAFNIGTQGRSSALGEQVLGRQFPLQQFQGLMGVGTNALNAATQARQVGMSPQLIKLKAKYDKEIAEMGYASAQTIAEINAATRGGGGSGSIFEDPNPPFPASDPNLVATGGGK